MVKKLMQACCCPQEVDAEARAFRMASGIIAETAYLVGVQVKSGAAALRRDGAALASYSVEDSLQELGRLASTAGLQVHWLDQALS